jgi:uncharacterized protein HemX
MPTPTQAVTPDQVAAADPTSGKAGGQKKLLITLVIILAVLGLGYGAYAYFSNQSSNSVTDETVDSTSDDNSTADSEEATDESSMGATNNIIAAADFDNELKTLDTYNTSVSESDFGDETLSDIE